MKTMEKFFKLILIVVCAGFFSCQLPAVEIQHKQITIVNQDIEDINLIELYCKNRKKTEFVRVEENERYEANTSYWKAGDAHYKVSEIIAGNKTVHKHFQKAFHKYLIDNPDVVFSNLVKKAERLLEKIREDCLLAQSVNLDMKNADVIHMYNENELDEKKLINVILTKLQNGLAAGNAFFDAIEAIKTNLNMSRYYTGSCLKDDCRDDVFHKIRILNIIKKCGTDKQKMLKCLLKNEGVTFNSQNISPEERETARRIREKILKHIAKHFCSENMVNTFKFTNTEFDKPEKLHGTVDYIKTDNASFVNDINVAQEIASGVLDNAIDAIPDNNISITFVVEENCLRISLTPEKYNNFPSQKLNHGILKQNIVLNDQTTQASFDGSIPTIIGFAPEKAETVKKPATVKKKSAAAFFDGENAGKIPVNIQLDIFSNKNEFKEYITGTFFVIADVPTMSS